jgi:hypothetical protein
MTAVVCVSEVAAFGAGDGIGIAAGTETPAVADAVSECSTRIVRMS